MKAIFLDRDGTVTVGVPRYERIDTIDKLELLPHVLEGLKIMAGLDYKVFFVTNQSGIAENLITMDDFYTILDKVLEMVAPSGIKITETYVCPHGEHEDCDCRKPKPTLLFRAAEKYGLDLQNSWMVGDRLTDVETGLNAGTKTILVKTGAGDYTDRHEANYTASDLADAARYIASH